MRRGAIPLLAAMLVVVVVFPAPVVAAPPVGTADVHFRPASVTAAVGGLFSVEVVIEAAAEVEGAQVVIAYDPAYPEFVSAQPTGPLTHHLSSEPRRRGRAAVLRCRCVGAAVSPAVAFRCYGWRSG